MAEFFPPFDYYIYLIWPIHGPLKVCVFFFVLYIYICLFTFLHCSLPIFSRLLVRSTTLNLCHGWRHHPVAMSNMCLFCRASLWCVLDVRDTCLTTVCCPRLTLQPVSFSGLLHTSLLRRLLPRLRTCHVSCHHLCTSPVSRDVSWHVSTPVTSSISAVLVSLCCAIYLRYPVAL